MTRIVRTAAALAFVVLSVSAPQAEPMKCSMEQQRCTSGCPKPGADQRAWRACMTSCSQQMAACRQTGCWSPNYCGLLRQ